jgi:hypothetical protein
MMYSDMSILAKPSTILAIKIEYCFRRKLPKQKNYLAQLATLLSADLNGTLAKSVSS